MAERVVTRGSRIYLGDGGSPETFSKVPQVTGISGPTREASEIDVTDLDSTSREFVAGLTDQGEITFNMNYDPGDTVHQQLRTNQTAGTVSNWALKIPATTPYWATFTAFVRGFPLGAEIESVWKGDITLRVTGTPVFSTVDPT